MRLLLAIDPLGWGWKAAAAATWRASAKASIEQLASFSIAAKDQGTSRRKMVSGYRIAAGGL